METNSLVQNKVQLGGVFSLVNTYSFHVQLNG